MEKIVEYLKKGDAFAVDTTEAVKKVFDDSLKKGKPRIIPVEVLINYDKADNISETFGKSALVSLLGRDKADIIINEPKMTKFIRIMGVLSSSVVLMFKKDNINEKPIICTRDEDVLNYLYKSKLLVGKNGNLEKETFEKQISDLKAGGTQKGALEGTTTFMKIEVASVEPKVKYTITKTRSCLNPDDYVMFPLLHIIAYGEEFNKYMSDNKYVKVTKQTEFGDKTHIITIKKEALIEVYQRAKIADVKMKVEQKLRGSHVGFDLNTLRYYGYDVESSIYVNGIASARVEKILKVEPVDIADIDISMANIDLSNIKRIFDKKIMNANKVELQALTGYLTLEPGVKYKVSDIKEKLIIWGNEQDATTLYKTMKSLGASTNEQSKKAFSDVDKCIETYARMQPKVTKDYIELTLSDSMTVEEKVEYLKERAKTHVLKITIKKKDGSVGTVVGTNNSRILAKVWGKNYIAKFETLIVRLKAARTEIEGGADIGDTIVKYDIMNSLIESGELDTNDVGGTIIRAINMAINDLKIKQTSQPPRTDVFKIKRLPVDNEKIRATAPLAQMKSNGLYRDINVNSIVCVEESRAEEK